MSDAIRPAERLRGAVDAIMNTAANGVDAALTRFVADVTASTAGRPAPAVEVPDAVLIAELRRDEGVKPHAYKDHLGNWTIGVGRLIDKARGGKLSDDEIDYLLTNDIARFKAELDAKLPWWRSLDEVRQRVVLNMVFNLGTAGLLGFKNTLAAIKVGEWEKASAGMLASRWAKQTGQRAVRLAKMMREGE